MNLHRTVLNHSTPPHTASRLDCVGGGVGLYPDSGGLVSQGKRGILDRVGSVFSPLDEVQRETLRAAIQSIALPNKLIQAAAGRVGEKQARKGIPIWLPNVLFNIRNIIGQDYCIDYQRKTGLTYCLSVWFAWLCSCNYPVATSPGSIITDLKQFVTL